MKRVRALAGVVHRVERGEEAAVQFGDAVELAAATG